MKKFCLLVFFIIVPAYGEQKLILVGGGDVPEAALRQMIDWRDMSKNMVLLITWAHSAPKDFMKNFGPDVEAVLPPGMKIEASPTLEQMTKVSGKRKFFEQLSQAAAVFFSGGYQERIMKVLHERDLGGLNRKRLKDHLLDRYQKGLVIAGTSAGTAIASGKMLNGDLKNPLKFWTEEGVGFLPPRYIVDQHFFARNREPRLKAVMDQFSIPIGIGIDEDTAAAIHGTILRVIGDGNVLILGKKHRDVLTPGTSYDIEKLTLLPSQCKGPLDKLYSTE